MRGKNDSRCAKTNKTAKAMQTIFMLKTAMKIACAKKTKHIVLAFMMKTEIATFMKLTIVYANENLVDNCVNAPVELMTVKRRHFVKCNEAALRFHFFSKRNFDF